MSINNNGVAKERVFVFTLGILGGIFLGEYIKEKKYDNIDRLQAKIEAVADKNQAKLDRQKAACARWEMLRGKAAADNAQKIGQPAPTNALIRAQLQNKNEKTR